MPAPFVLCRARALAGGIYPSRAEPPTIMSGKGKGGRKGKKGGSGKTKSAKAGIQFPVGRIGRHLKKGGFAKRVGLGSPRDGVDGHRPGVGEHRRRGERRR